MDDKQLFSHNDEREFKREFAVQFLAAMDAVNFSDNCHSGWKYHKPLVEDAAFLASKAWDEWGKTIGLSEPVQPIANPQAQGITPEQWLRIRGFHKKIRNPTRFEKAVPLLHQGYTPEHVRMMFRMSCNSVVFRAMKEYWAEIQPTPPDPP